MHNVILAGKKSLKKKLNKRSKDLNDYWDSVESTLWSKLDIQDVMDVPDRSITKGKKYTAWDEITSDLQDTSNNTTQFVKIINAHLKEKKSHIEKIIRIADEFEEEIEKLNADDEKLVKLKDTPIHEFKSDNLRKLAQELLKDRENRIEILKKLKSDIVLAEEELHKSNKQIEDINERILENYQR